jgi:tryptophanyl-tRNA synthetase
MTAVDPWGTSSVSDYARLIHDFGMSSMDEYRKRFDDFHYIRRGIIFGHRDFGKIADAITKKKRFAMMTGLMPSGRFHLGHKMVADEMIWFQGLGAEVFVCAADIESYLMRDIPFEFARKTALEEYLTNFFALGLSDKNLHFWFQSEHMSPYYRLRDMCGKRVTFNELKAVYGELSPGKILSSLTQAADILHPQLDLFGGEKPTVVPVGADQDPHIRLTRDLASRLSADREGVCDFKCVPPSATYHKFMSGLTGGKMSSSDVKSHIGLLEEPGNASKKIMSAKTGGRETLKQQKKNGGQPDICSVYELYLYHLVIDDLELSKIYHECKQGEVMCGECKRRCAELLSDFLKKHQKRVASARKKAHKLIDKS